MANNNIEKPLTYGPSPASLVEEEPMEIELELESMKEEEETSSEVGFYDNLAEVLDDDVLQDIGKDVLEWIQEDESSRSGWEKTLSDGLKQLGINPTTSEDLPFDGACSATHPLLMESIVKFKAKASVLMFPVTGPVKSMVVGKANPELDKQAWRIRTHMNYQLQCQMQGYEEQQDRMLMYLPLEGSAFKKVYWDINDAPCADFIKASNLIINYHAESLEKATRVTQKMEMAHNELVRYQLSNFYRDVDLDDPAPLKENKFESDVKKIEGRENVNVDDAPHTIYECHIDYDIPGYENEDGLKLPYVITLDENGVVLAVRRNWKEGDQTYRRRQWFVHYKFIPGLGFYGYGYIHLIGGLARSATSLLRQLIDAGMFANIPAGFKAKGLRVVGDAEPLRPGEWRDVHAPQMDLAKALLPLPYKEPSPTLFQLLGFVVQAAQRFADSTEQVVSESSNYGPVATTMALLEASGKLFTAIHKRLFRAQAHEFKLLAELNAENLPEKYEFNTANAENIIYKADYDDRIDVIPVADPDAPSEAQRISRSQMVLQFAQMFPEQHDLREALNRMYASAGVEDPERLLRPPPQQAKPMDPVSENMSSLTGNPLNAAPYQDHDAHIKVHSSFMVNPLFADNQQMLLALTAHMMEHLALKYHLEMQQAMGTELPPLGQQLPPEMENAIAIKAAQAADAILQQGMAEDIEQTSDDLNNDPMFALQKNEQVLQALKIGEQVRHNKAMEDIKVAELRKDVLDQSIDNMRHKWSEELHADLDLAKEHMRGRNAEKARKDTERKSKAKGVQR